MDLSVDDFLRALLGDRIVDAQEAIANRADYNLPDAQRAHFVQFRTWINSRPDFIVTWRSDPTSERNRYLKMMNAIESSENALAATQYHLDRISDLEDHIDTILSGRDLRDQLPQGASVAMPGTRKMDFEYHSFVHAYRRSLDHVCAALTVYFNGLNNVDSYSRFVSKVTKCEPAHIARPLAAIGAKWRGFFEFVVGDERGRSLRDRITHKEFVSAGTVSITRDGGSYVGGGELLAWNDSSGLTHILEGRLGSLLEFQCELLQTFTELVTQFEHRADMT